MQVTVVHEEHRETIEVVRLWFCVFEGHGDHLRNVLAFLLLISVAGMQKRGVGECNERLQARGANCGTNGCECESVLWYVQEMKQWSGKTMLGR